MTLVVGIDAGHGGENYGCVYGDLVEKEYTLKVALALEEVWQSAYGGRAILSRRIDDLTPFPQRARALRFADVIVSIHVNAYPGQEKPRGLRVFCPPDKLSSTLAFSMCAAGRVIQHWSTEVSFAVHHVENPAQQKWLRAARNVLWGCRGDREVPIALAELFFASTAADRFAARQIGAPQSFAAYLARGIADWAAAHTLP
jgi:N-acetylmuramoyl-L-alanine amidase